MASSSEKEKYVKIPNRDNHNCFGCSPRNSCGLKMEFYTDGDSVVSWLKVPTHLCGWNELVHGGVLSTIMDEIMSWSAVVLLRRFILTKSMSTEFLKPVLVDRDLKVTGRVKAVLNEREAEMEGAIFDDQGACCARSSGRFAIFTEEGIKKLGLFTEDLARHFERIFAELPSGSQSME